MTKHLFHNIIQRWESDSNTGCPKPCDKIQFKHLIREDLTTIYEEDVSYIFLFYESTTFAILEQYVLYDFNTIVAAVGGSLGLFIGFSCFEMCKFVSRVLCGKHLKHSKHQVEDEEKEEAKLQKENHQDQVI